MYSKAVLASLEKIQDIKGTLQASGHSFLNSTYWWTGRPSVPMQKHSLTDRAIDQRISAGR